MKRDADGGGLRVLKVLGKGVATAEPDMVTLAFSVEARARDYAGSVDDLNQRAEELRRNLEAGGLTRADLKTSGFGVDIDSSYKEGRRNFEGYRAHHNLSIEMPLEKKTLNRVLQQVGRGKSGAEVGLRFSVRDKDALRKRVLADAVAKARENAETLAAAAGVKLGQLLRMEYGWAEVRFTEQSANMVMESPSLEDSAPDIAAEDVQAEDTVTMVFEIQ